jgi:hypothetical protein
MTMFMVAITAIDFAIAAVVTSFGPLLPNLWGAMIRLLSTALFSLLGIWVIPASAEDFRGHPCTQDCSGHEAGYEWAGKKGIDSAGDCGGNSISFIEGCQAYVEENNPPDVDDSPKRDDEDAPPEE